MNGVLDLMDRQHGRLFLWLPVMFGIGIALFFGQNLEPSLAQLRLFALCFVAGLAALRKTPPLAAPLVIAMLAILAGFLTAALRTHMVAVPTLSFRYYGPVEGRVIHIDRSASEAVRLTLDRVHLRDTAPDRTPARVRISLHGEQRFVTPEPGQYLALTAHLSPPPGPTEPGGFDFQRMAWFDRLGAVGYTRVPVLRLAETDRSPALWLHHLRQTLSLGLQARLRGQVGAFAAAILTGDRAGISTETSEALRGANLSHLLAISGLHMGLMTGAVFYALRLMLALIPGAALRWPIKKLAAAGALAAGLFYFALSGWAVSTERAFIMVAVMLAAILIDRQAISLRAVALAALILLALRPEVLPEPGFQMSFAATTALVAVFTTLRRLRVMAHWPAPLRTLATIVISSAVAGIATAPVAAAHFNRIADYGLIANVAAVPLMGALIIPAALVALILTPIGLEGLALWVMGRGISWVLTVAQTVSAWGGAVSHVPAPPPATLPLIALGGLTVILWRGRGQFVGLAPVIAGFFLWTLAERPALLISDDGALVGRLTPEGRALSKPHGSGFAASSWLENDGDFADQAMAAKRDMPALDLGGLRILQISGRGWQDATREACAHADLVVVNQPWKDDPPGDCRLIDQRFLRQSGALALFVTRDGVDLRTAYGVSGLRLWNTPALQYGTTLSPKNLRAGLSEGQLGLTLIPLEKRLAQVE